jgi:hypothetical protein
MVVKSFGHFLSDLRDSICNIIKILNMILPTIALANRLREVLLDGKWIANTNFQEQILGLNWQQATQKIGDLNSIALLTFHINYYLGGLIQVFNGGDLEIRDKYSFDMPTIKTEEDWQTLVNEFLSNAETIASQVVQMSEKLLEQPFVDEKYGNYRRNIDGMIEHSYYHLGQVVIVRKMILSDAESTNMATHAK